MVSVFLISGCTDLSISPTSGQQTPTVTHDGAVSMACFLTWSCEDRSNNPSRPDTYYVAEAEAVL